jgi:DNA-binding NarL/FixJ family response regulator
LINVLIISPTPALRAGLRALLSGDPDLEVAVGTSLAELETPLRADASMPVVVATPGGVDLAAMSTHLGLALLLVTGEAQDIQALSGLDLRAWGVISPEATAEALQAAVRALAEGLVVASPDLVRQALPPAAAALGNGDGDDEAPVDPLTERENDVLLRLAQGLTNKQIALALGISEHTVKFHVSSIYTKLGVSSRTEALRKGARRGWVPL